MTAFSAAWLSWLVQGAWQAAVVGTFAILLASVTGHRRGFGAWERGLLGIALVKFLLPPFWGLPLPAFVAIPIPLAPLHAEGTAAGVALAPGIVTVHLMGSLAFGLLLVRDGLFLKRAARRAVRVTGGPLWVELEGVCSELRTTPPRLLLTAGGQPYATGILRRSVLLPRTMAESLPAPALRAVLAHEVAHHVRRDLMIGLLRNLVLVIWWFHPVAWWVVRLSRSAAEHGCDDVVLRRRIVDPEDYCRALLSAARLGRARSALSLGLRSEGKRLAARVRRILAPHDRRGLRPAAAWGLILLAGLLLPGTKRPSPLARDGADPIVRVGVEHRPARVVTRTSRRVVRRESNP